MPEASPFDLIRNDQSGDPTGRMIVSEVAHGWLASYVEYASALTDSPTIFHLAVGLSMLSTACGSKVVMFGGGREYWPNLYILFIAPSGLMRKTTSIELGLTLLRAADPDMIFPNEASREEFLRILSAKPEGLIKESEFASALARYGRDYMGGFKELITDLYDPTPEYRRQLRGKEGSGEKIIIKRPALNYLAASTLEWLVDSLTVNDMRSGFMSRFLLFPALGKGTWVSFLAEPNHESETALRQFLIDLRRLDRATVDFRPVNKRFGEWQRQWEGLSETGPSEVVGFYSRMTIHCAKVSALLAVSRDGIRKHYTIDDEIFDRASRLMEWLRDRYEELVERKLVFSKEERIMQTILELARKTGKIEWRLALRNSHLKTQDFQRYISTLLDRGELSVITEQTKSKPAKMICMPHANGKYEHKIADLEQIPAKGIAR